MPLPNYGHENKEKKTHQDLIFEMAPEIVSDEETEVINGERVKRKRGKVTTGKIGIDLERKIVINTNPDPAIWTTHIDQKDIEDAKRFSSPSRQVLKADVRKTLDSLISGSKAVALRSSRRPSLADSPPPSADYNKSVRFSLPRDNRQSEESVTGVSIQPSGTYRLGTVGRNSPGRSSVSPGKTSLTPNKSNRQDNSLTIGQRVDPRYDPKYDTNPPRQSLTQAYHAKSTRHINSPVSTASTPERSSSSSYSYSQVSETRSLSAHGIRGLN